MINHTVSARHLAIGLAASIPSPVQALHFLVISAPSARLGFWQHMFTVSGTRQLMYPDTNKASTQHGILSTVVLLCSQLHAPHAAVPHMSGLLYGLTSKPPNMPLTAPSHRMAPTCQRQCSPSPPQWRWRPAPRTTPAAGRCTAPPAPPAAHQTARWSAQCRHSSSTRILESNSLMHAVAGQHRNGSGSWQLTQ